jgi:thymidylate synthase
MSKFKIGDKVRKVTGYPFVGTVCATYDNEDKCCVKHKDKWEHIFSDKQLVYDHPEYQYLDLLRDILNNGVHREGRNGGTTGVFGRQIRFNLKDGFPLLTTKRIPWKAVAHELIWFLSGDTNIKYLKDNNVTIWDEWADENGDLGPVYGKQWRHWKAASDTPFEHLPNLAVVHEIDQIKELLDNIKKDPYSRRHVLTAWNPADISKMALPPCHCLVQFFVENGNLSCQLYQRSADVPLGVPFNIASYALLTHMIANECGIEVGEFVHTFGDAHIYDNQVDGIREQLEREPKQFPTLKLNNKPVLDMTISDISIEGYDPWPTIKMPVSK